MQSYAIQAPESRIVCWRCHTMHGVYTRASGRQIELSSSGREITENTISLLMCYTQPLSDR